MACGRSLDGQDRGGGFGHTGREIGPAPESSVTKLLRRLEPDLGATLAEDWHQIGTLPSGRGRTSLTIHEGRAGRFESSRDSDRHGRFTSG